MACARRGKRETRRDGQPRLGGQRRRCGGCGRRFTARSTTACSRHRLPDDAIALGVRWYGRGASADTLARGYALIRTLRGGFSPLTAAVTPNLRLATTWAQLIQAA